MARLHSSTRRTQLVDSLRVRGTKQTARTVRDRLWSTQVFLGLRCDLTRLPDVRRSKVELHMEPAGRGFDGFALEELRAEGPDLDQVCVNKRFHEAGLRGLHVAVHEGDPAYCQWLVEPEAQERLAELEPGAHPRLATDEVLLEGAYTFLAFRRMGAMADGMGQLLRIARDRGYGSAYTYVEKGNVASLRGCAAVGFHLDHRNESRWRLVRHATVQRPPDDPARSAWAAAIAPR